MGGNTRGLEMVWPTRHVGAGLRGLLGPTAHGLLGRRHPGPRLSHMVGRGWGLKYRDSQIFVRGAWHVLSYLGVWSLGLFSPTFFSTSSKKKTSPDREASLIKKEYCRCGPYPLQVISSRARPYLLRERATLAAFSRISGVGHSGS